MRRVQRSATIRFLVTTAPAVVMSLVISGCGSYTLEITQQKFINTAMHRGRPPERQTGEPMELDVVCVTPEDLEKPANEYLKPGSGITSKIWYELRPTSMKEQEGRFSLPLEQIYVLTNDTECYGKRKGRALAGALEDKTAVREVTDISFPKKRGSRNSAIYVFPRFVGPNRDVLAIEPAVFSPPGHYGRELKVKIGVRAGGPPDYGQFIEIRE